MSQFLLVPYGCVRLVLLNRAREMKRTEITFDDRQITERLERVNLVLRTIRNVDRVILKETNRQRVIQGVCQSLVATRGYYNAWIVLLDKNGKYVMAAESGLGAAFPPLAGRLKQKGPSTCGLQALERSEPIVIRNPVADCSDCPLSRGYKGRAGITSRLYYRRKVYGLLCASVPSSLTEEREESLLFEEIARDVAYALHKLELEEEHEQAKEALRRSENRYRALFGNASDAILVLDLNGVIVMANDAMSELSGYSPDELPGMNVSDILTPRSFKTAAAQQTKRRPFLRRGELQLVRKGGSERTVEVVSSLLAEGDETVIQTIARDITTQKRARENLRSYAEQAIFAQEEERKRIAWELHDETAQALASLGMDIGSLSRNKKLSAMQVSTNLESLQKKTEAILEGVRALSKALRPPMLEEFGLMAALRGLINEIGQQQIAATFKVEGTHRRLKPDAQITAYRIAQESLSNVKKHSGATECSLVVTYAPRRITLEICDNGRGFVPPRTADNLAYSGALGLAGMQERAKLGGGRLTIRSHPGEGTTVRLELPDRVTPPRS